jgi:tRNA dimethylallyltransferase
MSIGTAKPSTEELAKAAHHFINTLDIEQDYSVGEFEKDVLILLEHLFKFSNFVILVGGSGLFHKAVCEGLDLFPAIDSMHLEKAESLHRKEGIEGLQRELYSLDPEYFAKVDHNNSQRLKRALSVCYGTGKPYSDFLNKEKKIRNFKPVYFCTDLPRTELYQKINDRVNQMIEAGLEQEANALLPYQKKNSLQTVGYKEWFDFWNGKYPSREFTIDKIKQHSRNYAKRQITWFKNQGDYLFVDPLDLKCIFDKIDEII